MKKQGPQEESGGGEESSHNTQDYHSLAGSPPPRCLSTAGSSFPFSVSTVTPGKPLQATAGNLRAGGAHLGLPSLCLGQKVRHREGQGLARGHRAEVARTQVPWLPEQGSSHSPGHCRGVHINTVTHPTPLAHHQPPQSSIWASAT